MMAGVHLKIDGHDVEAPAGESLMHAAARAGVRVPGLCQFDGISTVGACRLCMVDVGGSPRPRPACATPVAEAMDVTTDSPRLREHRRIMLEMLFNEGQHICAVCVANGACELQDLAAELGVEHVSFSPPSVRLELDLSHPRFGYDPSRCVLCTRCVRTCAEVEGAFTWGVAGRGREMHLVADLGGPWGESTTCTSCGKCVSVCPVGALFPKGTSVAERRVPRALITTLTTRRQRESEREGVR
jgi:bidirectional [NiFe] hydrogenase diaphorase subunit